MIAIRTDANADIAMGHVMRCMSIASQLKKLGENVIFIVSEPDAKEPILSSGFKVICLNNLYKEKEREIPALYEILDKHHIEKVLIDSYEVTEDYLLLLSKKYKVYYLDDINKCKYNVDTIINYRHGAMLEEYKKWNYGAKTHFLVGSKYTPLREQFMTEKISCEGTVSNLLITSGGTDSYHIIKAILNRLSNDLKPNMMNIHVIVGRFYTDRGWLDSFIANNTYVKIYENVADMARIMKRCDVAISASGTTLYELAACGIPTIAFSMADNQLKSVEALASSGALLYMGDIRVDIESVINNIYESVMMLYNNEDMRKSLGDKAKSIVDGYGAKRIAQAIID